MGLTTAAEPIPLETDPSGTVRVGGTRPTLETLLAAYARGDSPEGIAAAFSGLQLADVYAVITYYLRHRPEIDAYLRAQEVRAAEVRAKIEARQGEQRGLRERLLARRGQTRSR
ncbi:MAG TPA: DUF433 domain-containing protein [Roseiflexaceae bacterium]|nr:DUF433 domain-containing protein [Roseiflexaceae bacterium]